LRFIGRVADGSTETFAKVILLKGLEREIFAEELVLIKNGGDAEPSNQILGVLRGGLGRKRISQITKRSINFSKSSHSYNSDSVY